MLFLTHSLKKVRVTFLCTIPGFMPQVISGGSTCTLKNFNKLGNIINYFKTLKAGHRGTFVGSDLEFRPFFNSIQYVLILKDVRKKIQFGHYPGRDNLSTHTE
jgi:hypothetical protein